MHQSDNAASFMRYLFLYHSSMTWHENMCTYIITVSECRGYTCMGEAGYLEVKVKLANFDYHNSTYNVMKKPMSG